MHGIKQQMYLCQLLFLYHQDSFQVSFCKIVNHHLRDWAIEEDAWHRSSQQQLQLFESNSFHPPNQPTKRVENQINEQNGILTLEIDGLNAICLPTV